MADGGHHLLADWQILTAPAKINLTLNIAGKNQIGYHLLHSHVAFCGLADRVMLKIADENSHETDDDILQLTGAFAYQLDGLAWQDNLLAKALQLLRQHIAIPALEIRLEKNIPSGAGLAGGTADAAAIVRFFATQAKDRLNMQTALKLAQEIGGDGLCCYHACAGLMQGTGEIFTPYLQLQQVDYQQVDYQRDDITLLILWAGKPLSTALIYQQVDYQQTDYQPAFYLHDSADNYWYHIAQGSNDLQKVAQQLLPEIQQMEAFIQHHIGDNMGKQDFIRMTGSGSAIYAIFHGKQQALQQDILPAMQAALPKNWFLWAGKLHDNDN